MGKKKKLIIIIGSVAAMAAFIIAMVILGITARKNYITNAGAAKQLVLLESDKDGAAGCRNYYDSDNQWYEKYMNYMYEHEYLDVDKLEATDKNANKAYTYGSLKRYLTKREISYSSIYDVTGINVGSKGNSKKITRKDMNEIYSYLVTAYGSQDGVHSEELVIAGTPSNIEDAGRWQAYTQEGSFGFEGLALDGYIDTKIMAYVRDREIISVVAQLSDKVTYNNIWLEKGADTSVTAYIGGVKRQFNTGRLTKEFTGSVGDISVEKGKVTLVSLKQDLINGKVLMIDENKVEIEGYGQLELDDNFHAYKTYGVVQQIDSSQIMVGYSITDFVVAGSKVCAAVVSEALSADNIRVIIMTSNYTSLFHERVSVTGTGSFTVHYGDISEEHQAGEIVDIYKDSSYLDVGRVSISSDDSAGRLTVLNVERAYGNPSYRGIIEVAAYDEGLAIVNDVPIEEYLYAVVPSEMPNRFGVEALKVQAVCARSYAYRHLLNNSYSRYGAHVDDSVNFQVYNNVNEQEDSTQAVRETYGQVAAYNGEPITTYYYSTSCGHTTDVSVWGGNPAGTPYLTAKEVNPSGAASDLSSEEAFDSFISDTDPACFDNGFGYYRWNVTMPLSELTESVNEYIFGRYCADPSRVKTYVDGSWISQEVHSVGAVTQIKVNGRSSGGCLTSIIIYGTERTVLIENELNIRYVLCPRNNPITLLKGDTTTFYILPSAYCRFQENYEGDVLTGYTIYGGGYGHGIGMSQNGVSNMVKAGMTYDEILKFFYEGTQLMDVYGE